MIMKLRTKKIIGYSLATIAILVVLLTAVGIGFIQYSLNGISPYSHNDEAKIERMCKSYPFLTDWISELSHNHELRDTFITNGDGVKLHAYYAKARKASTLTAVIVHGYQRSAFSMLHIGYLYHHDFNMNILLVDLQSHGDSEGNTIQMGWFDRLDVLEWIKLTPQLFGGEQQVVVHGISMGGATTMMLSGDATPSYVKAFVDDCGYTSVFDEFKHELKKRFGLPAFPLLYTTSLVNKVLNGWSFQEASALKQVAKCTKPMLFIHGDSDNFVPTEMVYRLYEAKPEPKQLWIAPDTPHALAFLNHHDIYKAVIYNFIKKYMPINSQN